MRLVAELEPPSVDSAGILAKWRTAWSAPMAGEEVELAPASALAALLDLQERCYEQGLTVNVLFPDNQ